MDQDYLDDIKSYLGQFEPTESVELTDEERRDIKKEKLVLKDQIARIENKYDYDQHGGGIEYFGYNGA